MGINSASTGWSPTACEGLVSASACSTSARFHAGLIRTADAPSSQMARNAKTNSGRLDDMSATRSPARTPRCSRVVAMPLVRASSSDSVYSRSSKASAIASLTACPHPPLSASTMQLRIAYHLSRMIFSNSQNRCARRGLMTAEPVPNSPADAGQVTIVLDRKNGVGVPGGERDASRERPARRSVPAVLL